MKYVISILMIFLSLCLYGQRGKTKSFDNDTLKGVDTVYIYGLKTTGTYYTYTSMFKFIELGGISDGIMIMQGGQINTTGDTIWITLEASNILDAYPNDTVTITSNGVVSWVLYQTPFDIYRWVSFGTSGDTTKIVGSYNYK